jgi:hypothetical protein
MKPRSGVALPLLVLAWLIAPSLSLRAQVPAPVRSLAWRTVRPAMASTTTSSVLNGTSPLFQYQDGKWNNGEGFTLNGTDADKGGWLNEDDGTGLIDSDIHTTVGWSSWNWASQYHPAQQQPVAIRRFVGYMRPNDVLPTAHPLYGPLPAGSGPFSNGTYVDQGAFEVFAPSQGPATATTPIVVIISNWQTQFMPLDFDRRQFGWLIYQGYFSPDGLVRNEKSATALPALPSRGMAGFLGNTNTGDDTVLRPPFLAQLVATAGHHGAGYWPIAAYAVQTVPGRQTTLQEQRNMQMLQAVLLMLQQPDSRNPLYPNALTAQQVADRVVVVFVGGSNGGHQSMWAAMRYPDKVHGAFCEVINPSIQRLFGEHDLGFAFSRLAGLPEQGATVTEWDFMNWGRYAWNQGYWIHDISFTRRQHRDQIFRPSYFRVGDEDITSTGTDWVSLVNGAWAASGQSLVPSAPSGWPASSKLSWSVTKTACHGELAETPNPYTGGSTFHFDYPAQGLINEAIANRGLQVSASASPTSVASEDRTASPAEQQLRGLDDPHEWALGRVGPGVSVSNTQLVEDAAWFEAVQPGAAGTWLGYKEAILIRDQRLYVVGAEGVVSCFQVDLTAGNRHRLEKVAQSTANGRPRSLGLEGFALAALPAGGSGWQLVVGTRRHLWKLDPGTLDVVAGPVELPWEVAQPHHMKVADVLPTQVNSGLEITFASAHGGLVFYSAALAPIYEWPEPGIVDFEPTGDHVVTVLSHRGVVADVSFAAVTGVNVDPILLAASRPIPRQLQEYTTVHQDPPSQGRPHDLEMMRCAHSGGVATLPVALWTADEDAAGGCAVRKYVPGSRLGESFAANIAGIPLGRGGLDMAPCRGGVAENGEERDHLLVLTRDRLHLFDEAGAPVGDKILFITGQAGNPYFPFGRQACAIAVGDLIDNSATGSTGPFDEEVVVASQSGALLWLHINDIAEPGSALSSAYDLVNVGASGSAIQPRANQSMSATWAMAERGGDLNHLHLLDQRGAYWRVGGTGGAVTLRDRDVAAVGARGWDDLGNRNSTGTAIAHSASGWQERLEIGPDPNLPPGLSSMDCIRLIHGVRSSR